LWWRLSNTIAYCCSHQQFTSKLIAWSIEAFPYAIRIGIERGLWQVAIYLPDNELPEERTVVGARQDAEIAARSIIDAWLKKRCRKYLL
jgi:hypothetical protein